MAPIAHSSADIAYVRFHGRNTETWEAPARVSADRFDWYYSPQELASWVPKIHSLQEQAREVHVLFNTNSRDQGPYNSIMMGRLLGEGLGDDEAVTAVESRLGLSPDLFSLAPS